MLSVQIGTCRIAIRFSFFALLAFCCIFTGIGIGLSCFFAAILHESAHLLMMWLFGAPPDIAELSAMGCRVEVARENRLTDRQQALISLAGPGGNLFAALASWAVGLGSDFAGINLAMCLMHSLPIEPLDGGLALRYVLRNRFGVERAEQASRVVSLICLFPLAAAGYFLLLRTKYNFSLLALSMYLTVYLFLGKDYSQP